MFVVEVRGWSGSIWVDLGGDDEKTFFRLAAERRDGQALGRTIGPLDVSGAQGTERPPSCRRVNRGVELSIRGVTCADPGRLPMKMLVLVDRGTSPGIKLVTVRGPVVCANSGVAR